MGNADLEPAVAKAVEASASGELNGLLTGDHEFRKHDESRSSTSMAAPDLQAQRISAKSEIGQHDANDDHESDDIDDGVHEVP